MCERAVEKYPCPLEYVPDNLKTQMVCIKTLEVDPSLLKHAPDYFKTQKMCDDAVRDYLFSLQFVPDWFVTQQQIDIWHDDNYVYNDRRMIKCYEGYKKRKAQKSKIKDNLMPIAWHPSRWWDWCVPDD